MSGGQGQRIAIVRAFACEPDLVLCDEFTSALDVTVQAQVLELMERLQRKQGTSYLLIFHDLPVAARMLDIIRVLCDRQVRDLAPAVHRLAGTGTGHADTLIGTFHANARTPCRRARGR